jgi:hypothetical protein
LYVVLAVIPEISAIRDIVEASVADPDLPIHRIHMFLDLLDPDPDPLIRNMDPSTIKQK